MGVTGLRCGFLVGSCGLDAGMDEICDEGRANLFVLCGAMQPHSPHRGMKSPEPPNTNGGWWAGVWRVAHGCGLRADYWVY